MRLMLVMHLVLAFAIAIRAHAMSEDHRVHQPRRRDNGDGEKYRDSTSILEPLPVDHRVHQTRRRVNDDGEKDRDSSASAGYPALITLAGIGWWWFTYVKTTQRIMAWE